ncbi:hypothetical protein P5673_021096 [Acropora cervicornis]|uniref:MARVEL domain-containing protein n=1 Tax=Acropora cervicornis TaxID=6130 RepID=A0AAD9Q8V8_ACRCE|nr:hypothetical protein P5673_021096 [Acropora cervicornis]
MIINKEYVKSSEGILKFMEIIAIFAAFSCLGDFDRDVTIWGNRYQVRYDIFMGAFIMGWIIVLFVFCVFLFSLESRIMIESNWNQVINSKMNSGDNPDECEDYITGPTFNKSYLCSVQGYMSWVECVLAFAVVLFLLIDIIYSLYLYRKAMRRR